MGVMLCIVMRDAGSHAVTRGLVLKLTISELVDFAGIRCALITGYRPKSNYAGLFLINIQIGVLYEIFLYKPQLGGSSQAKVLRTERFLIIRKSSYPLVLRRLLASYTLTYPLLVVCLLYLVACNRSLLTPTMIPTAPVTASSADLSEFYLYVRTQSGVAKVSSTGSMQMIIDKTDGQALEILSNEVYLNDQTFGGDILVYDLEGKYLRTIPTPPQASEYLHFVTIPDGRIALLDNVDDKIYFVDSSGNLLATTIMIDNPDSAAQNLDGVIVDNRLIFSEDGYKHILEIDLDTYGKSIFQDLTGLLPDTWLGAITYMGGRYYLATPDTIYGFSDNSAVVEVAKLPENNITGIVVLDNLAYVSVNFSGEIYEVNLSTGDSKVFVAGLDYPVDLEISK